MNQAEVKRRQAEALSEILMLIIIYIMGRLTGDNGVTYLAVAAEVCALMWTAASGSLSDALGKLLRSRKNKGQYNSVLKLRRIAMMFHGALGLAGSLILFALSGSIAEKVFRIPYSALLLAVLSPIVFFRSVSAVLLGYFRGEGAEFPRAAAGVLRQVFLLGFGVLFGSIQSGYGEKVSNLLQQENFKAMHGGAGIAFSVSLAEALVIVFLLVVFRSSRRPEKRTRTEAAFSTDSSWECVRYLYISRWPQVLTEFLLLLPLPLGLWLLGGKAPEGVDVAYAYGMYLGKYLVVSGVFLSLVWIVAVPVIGRVFLCFKREENRFARTVFQSGVHSCLVHGIFAAMFVAVMGIQIAGFLCPEEAEREVLAQMLSGGSCLIVFGVLSRYFVRFLHAIGKKYPVLCAVCAAEAVFVMTAAISVGKTGALSLIYGGVAGIFLLSILLGAFAYRQMRIRVDWLGLLAVPVGAGGVSGLVCMLLRNLFAPHLGDLMTLFVAFLVSGAIYWILLLLLRNFKEQELEVIVGGRLIGILGQILRVY